MARNRIRELRKNHSLQQESLGIILNTTQQTISRMETGLYDIPTDLLIQMSKYFNVTTDYILGLTDIKRDLSCQTLMNHEIDQHYDIILRYKNLTDINKKTFMIILERLEQAQREMDSSENNINKKEGKNYVTDSDM